MVILKFYSTDSTTKGEDIRNEILRSHSKQSTNPQRFTQQSQHKITHPKFSKLLTTEPNENNFLHRTSSETENTEVIRSNSKISHELRRIHSTNHQPELYEVFDITNNQELKTTSQHISRVKNLKTDE